jgi:hypothetical protein
MLEKCPVFVHICFIEVEDAVVVVGDVDVAVYSEAVDSEVA